MRLIDADKLMEYANNAKDKSIDANDIARFPTADPVKHGHWHSYQQSRFYCIDEYGKPIFRDGYSVYAHIECGLITGIKSAYCPRCGAKMDEVRE